MQRDLPGNALSDAIKEATSKAFAQVIPQEQAPTEQVTPQPVATEPQAEAPVAPVQDTTPEQTPEVKVEAGEPAAPVKEEPVSNLRRALKDSSTKISSLEEELNLTKQALEKYNSGEAIPETLVPLHTEVTDLRAKVEKFDFGNSPAFRKTKIEPMLQAEDDAIELGKEFELPSEVISEALNSSRQEAENFAMESMTPLGAAEFMEKYRKYNKLKKDAQDTILNYRENKPKVVEAYESHQAQIREQEVANINALSKKGWAKGLESVQSHKILKELIPDPVDVEHNKKYVEPLVANAATQYGRLINKLVEGGLKTLPEDLASELTTLVCAAVASNHVATTRDLAVKHAETVSSTFAAYKGTYTPVPGVGTATDSTPANSFSNTGNAKVDGFLNSVANNLVNKVG